MQKNKITLVGSGNVAWHLAKAFDLAGHQIHQIVSRNEIAGKELAKNYAAFFENKLENVFEDSDFVFLTLPDKAIEAAIQKIKAGGPIFLHCAGSCSLTALSNFKKNTGVFYPLQTFTKERKLNFFDVPVFVEASDQSTFQKIWDLADSISNTVKHLDSEKRLYLHLAAVVANNFTNHLLFQAEKVMMMNELPLEWLKPLVEETVKKAFELGPENSQTGPAMRHDETTLKKHLKILESNPELKELYEVISRDIGT
ncbi:MAG: Rossmann-like and DUF2520 domain-containing protein [Bacteroidia bacterium]